VSTVVAPAFMRKLRYREHSTGGFLALCPFHQGGFDLFVREEGGRWRFECLDEWCEASEADIIRALDVEAADLRAYPDADVAFGPATEFVVLPVEQFAVDEPGGAALLGDADNVVVAEGMDVLLYGDGGAGKTTLGIDAACHFAAGDAWLGIDVPQPLTVLMIEDEGPRPLFRSKLRRKITGWQGAPLGERLLVLEQPWARFTFANAEHRAWLAAFVRAHNVDLVMVGAADGGRYGGGGDAPGRPRFQRSAPGRP
jgi:AAA domain